MLYLVAIYGTTFCAVSLLTLSLVPLFWQKARSYLKINTQKTSEELEELFIDVPRRRVAMIYASSPVVCAAIGWLLVRHPLVCMVGGMIGVVLPRVAVRFLKGRRREQFARQLVDALLLLSSSLKAGLSLPQAIDELVRECGRPAAEEFGLVAKETKMGVAFDDSLKRLLERMPSDELHLIVTAVLVARETGGDLTKIFAKLVETIRERQKLKERMKSLTTMPRLQGWLMGTVPALFTFFALKISPGYFEMFFHDSIGALVGLGAIVLWLAGLVLIFYISRPPT